MLRALIKVGLPGDSHPTSDRAWRQRRIEKQRTGIKCLVRRDISQLDAGQERTADTGKQRCLVQRRRPISRRDPVERQEWLGGTGDKFSLCPSCKDLVLRWQQGQPGVRVSVSSVALVAGQRRHEVQMRLCLARLLLGFGGGGGGVGEKCRARGGARGGVL